ncbi:MULTISPECIES: OmpA family protein [Roseobacteraceae]|uniref:OmpA family protein n=1 Tax=Roseobacteraceae TaxID=2854170 RepID=UPI001CD7EEAE|nr:MULTISPECIES: OmpA family protein [Roseobacteraceae]MCA0997682.1 OmpA family protein [Alloyangia pacifica]
MIKGGSAALALALVAGCSQQETGSDVDGGNFGNATMNNSLVMTGQQNYVLDLSSRFASEVPSMVNFAFNSTVLDAAAQQVLRQQATWIRQFPEIRFRVYGHTDLVGNAAYNKSLGLRRAQAVVRFLATQGISTSRLEAVVSFGETQPLIVTEGRERRNRRTVTEVSGFVQDHPNLLDGKYAEVIYREYVRSAEPTSTVTGTTLTGGGE